MRNKVLIVYSGGFDSTAVLLERYKTTNSEIHLIYFDYGQKVAPLELHHVRYWKETLDVHLEIVKLPKLSWSGSSMLSGKAQFGNDYQDEYVEARNMIFLSYALSYCEANSIDEILLGFISTGNDYPDASPLFVDMMNLVARNISGVNIHAPFSHLSKLHVMTKLLSIGVDVNDVLNHTITCNTPIKGKPCGECDSCNELNSLKLIFQKDCN